MRGPFGVRRRGLGLYTATMSSREEAPSAVLRAAMEGRSRGVRPRLFFAPGRVNLMGAHLDYNGGAVMPMALDRGTVVAARPLDAGVVRFSSLRESGVFEGRMESLPERAVGRWFDYPLGVLRQFADQWPTGQGVEFVFGGDLAIGAGLSSSASICVATGLAATALVQPDAERWSRERGLPRELARRLVDVALEAERNFVGVRCGIMDPHAVALGRSGHLLWLDCRDRRFEHVPLDTARHTIGVVDSRVRRELAAGEFNARVSQCAQLLERLAVHVPGARWLRDVPREVFDAQLPSLPALLAARGRHVFGEFERTARSREALLAGDAALVGRLMVETHASLRQHYEVSTPELDSIVDLATSVSGVLGARVTGAGFGGACVVLLERGCEDALRNALVEPFTRRHHHAPGVEFFAGGVGPHEIEASV
jgi:galactokinase